MFFHIDANCFFARCEEILRPELENVPFVVGHSHDHAIICCASKKAREYQIKAAETIYSAKLKCHNIIVVDTHFDWYQKLSQQMFETIKKYFTNEIEVMSIDECYINVDNIISNYHNNYELLALDIIKTIKTHTKLDVTIGIGETKFLAKMAGDSKPINKIAHIYQDEIKHKLWNTNLKNVFMMGRKTVEKLNELGIYTVADFIQYPQQEKLANFMMKKYDYFIKAFYGNQVDEIAKNVQEKSISQSKTFITSLEQEEVIKNYLQWLTSEVCLILQQKDLYANVITIYLKYETDRSNCNKSKSKKLSKYLNDFNDIYEIVNYLFKQFWNGEPIRLIGISVSNLINSNDLLLKQIKLF